MTDYVISDVHVKWDMKNSECLKKFINMNFQPEDRIFMLGDIFDLMVGNYIEYETQYHWFFDRIKQLALSNIQIIYLQGNHDFHIEDILNNNGVIVKDSPFIEVINGKKVLFCHGDEIEIGNFNYRVWRRFIRSYPMALVSRYVFNYKIVKSIGDYLSKKSRHRNEKRYGDSQDNLEIRDKFRTSAKLAALKYQSDIVICGHSHFMDDYKCDEFEYYNCGFVPATQKYLEINEIIKLKDL